MGPDPGASSVTGSRGDEQTPRNKIGRPGGYISAATLYDQVVTCTELGVECGATVEV